MGRGMKRWIPPSDVRLGEWQKRGQKILMDQLSGRGGHLKEGRPLGCGN